MWRSRTLLFFNLLLQRHLSNPNPVISFVSKRSVWSMTKDPSLESALSRNRRWIVNNQIKNILLRCPDQTATVRSLQKKYKTLDLRGRALNWLKKYPCCFEIFTDDHGEILFRFSKRMVSLIEEEESVREEVKPLVVQRLAKVLMLSRDHKLNVVKLNELKRGFGLPDDYIVRILPEHPEMFRIVNRSGRRNSMELELIQWNADLAVSAIQRQKEPKFSCSLPLSWVKSRERFDEFNEGTPYVSPYNRDKVGSEKWGVGMVHELLSLTLWKKASIVKLGHFRGEFGLPERLSHLLLKHPCIFYVSNRYKIYTVVLREGYCGSELVEKDPMVVVKEKFGELMQEGLYEYNRRRYLVNLEKKRERGEVAVRVEKEKEELVEQNDAYKTEERRRFYKVLFDDNFQ